MKKMSTNEMRNDRRRNRSKRNNIAHPSRPRLVVYRSNKHISAQVINDHDGNTLASASSLDKTIEKLVKKANSKDIKKDATNITARLPLFILVAVI